MTLAQNRPVHDWPAEVDVFDSFDRLFDRLARPTLARDGEAVGYGLDLFETDDALVLEMPVPGMDPDDLDVSLEGRQLSVRGTLPELEREGRRYWVQGVARGQFARSLRLPVAVEAEAIDARVQNGLLTLTMPKAQEAKVKKIAIARD